jgi:hypothetical protein
MHNTDATHAAYAPYIYSAHTWGYSALSGRLRPLLLLGTEEPPKSHRLGSAQLSLLLSHRIWRG